MIYKQSWLASVFIIILGFSLNGFLIAQNKNSPNQNIVKGVKIDGEYIPHFEIKPVHIFFSTKNEWNSWKYQRLIHNIKIVYPFAKKAKRMFYEMNRHYKKLESKRAKRRYAKKVKKRIVQQYKDELKDLTIDQGQLLIKLIDRELGNTSYEILQEYRGSFSAFFWQSLARLFGSNLKAEYNPHGEDKIIEELIYLYEHGQL